MIFSTATLAWSGEARLGWNPNLEADLAGYKMYYGSASRNYTASVDVGLTETPQNPTHTLRDLPDGITLYFAVTAYDTSGNESGFSNECVQAIPPPEPVPPRECGRDVPPGSPPPPPSPSPTPPTSLEFSNDGAVDPNTGMCLGQVLIFNGNGAFCRKTAGGDVTRDCCAMNEALLSCNAKEEALQTQRKNGLCHEVGTYCSRCALGGEPGCNGIGNFCVERSAGFCCFGSKLGRILQEQGRPQLQAFAPDGQWDLDTGDGISPNCAGYSPTQLQMLDFSRINLSEYFGDIQPRSQNGIENTMGNQVNEFYKDIRP
ncbi:MAG: conjugal transfer protein TraN [Candidatus Manganitrophaceae bacterium]